MILMIRAAIFDLDNCLSAADEVGSRLFEPAFAAIRQANHGTLSEERLCEAFADCWRHPLDFVAAKYGFTAEMLAAGWKIFAKMEVREPMHGYGDLNVLAGLPVPCFLVTSGFRRLQESKIRALQCSSFFIAIFIDAIDETPGGGKQRFFEAILKVHGFQPGEVLAVGDNPDSEIAVANRMGITSVQILRPGVIRSNTARHHIHNLEEFRDLLGRLAASPNPKN